MACDGRRLRAITPERLARLGARRSEPFAVPQVRQSHDVGGAARDGRFVVAHDVADQHHLGQRAALRLGRVAHGLQVPLVEVLESGELHAGRATLPQQFVADLDDRRDRVARLAEELEADRADMRRHAMDDPARRRDDAVAAFLLDAGETTEKFVGDVLAEPRLAEDRAGNFQPFGAQHLRRFRALPPVFPGELERGDGCIVDPAAVVPDARHFEPVALRVDHAPPGEVVERGAPQHGLLAAGIHRDIAADDRCVGRRRIDCEDEARGMRSFLDAPSDDTCLGEQRGDRLRHAGQRGRLDLVDALELLDVDHGRERRERHGAAGVAGAAAAWNHGEPRFEAGAHESGDLGLGVGHQHDKGRFDAPVGRVGRVRHPRVRVEADVVTARVGCKRLAGAPAHRFGPAEGGSEVIHRSARESEQLADLQVARGVGRVAALLDVGQAMMQCLHQQLAPPRVVEQVLLQVRVAPHDPDVAEHLVQHACRASGAALSAQIVEQLPAGGAEQPDHDLAVREGRVVVGNLAQARWRIEICCVRRGRDGSGRDEVGGVCVHLAESSLAVAGRAPPLLPVIAVAGSVEVA